MTKTSITVWTRTRHILPAVLASAALLLLAPATPAAPASASPACQVRPSAPIENLRKIAAAPTRVTGSEGCAQAAEFIRKTFESLGMEPVVETFETAFPVQKSGALTVEGLKPIPIHALWPNLTHTSSVHRDGLLGHLVYIGRGSYAEMDGLDMEGAIALIEFDSGDNLIQAMIAGAKGIIFIEPQDASRTEGEMKWLCTPADIPRFWVSKADGEQLKKLARAYAQRRAQARKPFASQMASLRDAARAARLAVEQAVLEGAKRATIEEAEAAAKTAEANVEALRKDVQKALNSVQKVTVRLEADVKWRDVTGQNVWAILPGSEERAWVAQYTTALQALTASLDSPGPEVQKTLSALKRLAVRPLAREDVEWHAAFEDAFTDLPEAAQNSQSGQDLRAAAKAKPKHALVVLQAHYDSISVVPTLAPGAEQACGVSVLLELARAFAAAPPKRTTLFLATAGHAQMLRGMSAWVYAHCLDEKTIGNMTLPEFQEMIKEPIKFDLLIGLDLTTGSRRMGVFYQSHATRWLGYVRAQAQSYYRAFGSMIARHARQYQAETDLVRLDNAM
ncbi:MAG TPA: M28 family peptidase, partial [Candidatus Brocadiia bacterium]|nr:M28 family peptidase [Candidatus Brocadiia bacterium]